MLKVKNETRLNNHIIELRPSPPDVDLFFDGEYMAMFTLSEDGRLLMISSFVDKIKDSACTKQKRLFFMRRK